MPAGQTVRVALDSLDGGGANELYVRRGALPSSIQFDAAFPGGLQPSQTATIPTTTAGTYYVLVRSQGGPATSQLTLQATSLPFAISGVTPDEAGAGRYATVSVSGAMFSPQATVKLIRPQFGEFVPVNYQVVDATRIVAVFDLRTAPLGLYDLQVANPDGTTAVVPYRLLVADAQPLDATVGLGGPDLIIISKAGVPNATYAVSLLSLTNVDAPYVFLQFGVPRLPNNTLIPGERLLFQSNLAGAPNVDGVPWADLNSTLNLNGVLTASGFAHDFTAKSFGSLTFNVEIYPELKRLLKENPQFLQQLSDYDLASLQFDYYIFAAATPMTSAEYVAYQTTRAADLRARILSDAAAPQALVAAATDAGQFTSFYLAALQQAGELRPEDTPPAARAGAAFDSNVAVMVAGLLANDTGTQLVQNSVDNLAGFFDLIRKWAGHTPDAYGGSSPPARTAYDLSLSSATRFEAFTIHVKVDGDLFSGDSATGGGAATTPEVNLGSLFNAAGSSSPGVSLTGPSGFGPLNFVPAGYDLPYFINYAQSPTATAPVRELRIVQQLDPSLDERSFQLGPIRLGDLTLPIPSGRGAFSGEFDFVADRGYILQVVAGVDVVERVANWTIRAIDADTGNVTDLPNVGLVKPGQTGQVSYTIQATPQAQTGATIAAQARVFADNGAPIDTNRITAILDAQAPVTTLNVTNDSNGNYTLQWSAVDDAQGSGVRDFATFVSFDGRIYSPIALRTTDTRASYSAPAGTTPSFLVLATDQAGNVEAAPDGLSLPIYNSGVNLGALPLAPPVELAAAANRAAAFRAGGQPAVCPGAGRCARCAAIRPVAELRECHGSFCRGFVRDGNPGFRRGDWLGRRCPWSRWTRLGQRWRGPKRALRFRTRRWSGERAVGAARYAGLLARVRPGQPALGDQRRWATVVVGFANRRGPRTVRQWHHPGSGR